MGLVWITTPTADPAGYEACNAEYVEPFLGSLPAHHTGRFRVPTKAKVGSARIALAGE